MQEYISTPGMDLSVIDCFEPRFGFLRQFWFWNKHRSAPWGQLWIFNCISILLMQNLLSILIGMYSIDRGVINGKGGKAAALHKFSDTLTLSQPKGGGRLCPPFGFVWPNLRKIYAPFWWGLWGPFHAFCTSLLYISCCLLSLSRARC